MSDAPTPNQHAEQVARDKIDAQLRASGWAVQDKDSFKPNEGEGEGQAVREYTTDTGPADYVLTRFTDQRDPKPRSREVFAFHRPETLREHLSQVKSLRAVSSISLPSIPPTSAIARSTPSPSWTSPSSRPSPAPSSRWPPGQGKPSPPSPRSIAC